MTDDPLVFGCPEKLTLHPVYGPLYGYRDLADGRIAYIVPLTFARARICIGDAESIEHGFCYDTPEQAIAAFEAWDGTGEPDGWMRSPTSGRRRPGGDAAKEYVRW